MTGSSSGPSARRRYESGFDLRGTSTESRRRHERRERERERKKERKRNAYNRINASRSCCLTRESAVSAAACIQQAYITHGGGYRQRPVRHGASPPKCRAQYIWIVRPVRRGAAPYAREVMGTSCLVVHPALAATATRASHTAKGNTCLRFNRTSSILHPYARDKKNEKGT